MEKVTITDSISQTLFINIAMKAYENQQPDRILEDIFSEELMGKLDYDFSQFPGNSMVGKGVVIRARYFDDQTRAFIEQNKNKNLVVVHVGAGLDTRFLRINGGDQPALFYELDLPDVIQLREKVLPSAENEILIKTSMFDTAWMDELCTRHPKGHFLFVMEGIVFYFPEQKIRKLFCDLADRFSGGIICDFASTWLSKKSQRNKVLKKMNTSFDFGIDDERRINAWHPQIQYLKSVPTLKLQPQKWGFWIGRVMANMPVLKNSCKIVTFKLG